ncbi:MAG: 23S rRNA (pseudouridine(1915)-N(3))-methyltransferase RlmH [Rickettsiaceae bacterium]|nr:23S rRNA (pseudouridine(1915)-N(3))-methyltransferase RlmH [Rickettsiaceae bacterium]
MLMAFKKIIITSIGKIPAEYKALLLHYTNLIKTKINFRNLNGLTHLPIKEQIIKESRLLQNTIGDSEFIIILDEKGINITSYEFAKTLNLIEPFKAINFIIGGSYGLSESFKNMAHMKLSLSPMTLPHKLVKIIVLEQIYRAEDIIKGGKYHK